MVVLIGASLPNPAPPPASPHHPLCLCPGPLPSSFVTLIAVFLLAYLCLLESVLYTDRLCVVSLHAPRLMFKSLL